MIPDDPRATPANRPVGGHPGENSRVFQRARERRRTEPATVPLEKQCPDPSWCSGGRTSRSDGCELDVETESSCLPREASKRSLLLLLLLCEIDCCLSLFVDLAITQQRVDDPKDLGCGGHDGLVGPAPGLEVHEVAPQAAALRSHGSPRDLDQERLEPLRALAGPSASWFAGGRVRA